MTNLCATEIKLIRGDSFELYAGLAKGWDDLAEDPGAYQGRLAFREMHDDNLPVLVASTSPLIMADDVRFPDMFYVLHFTLSPAETQSLPPSPLVAFAELRALTGGYVRRLFNAKVHHGD